MNVTLSEYVAEVRRLVHDPNDNFWSEADKIANINRAIRRRDTDTGANRVLITTFALTVGQDKYTLTNLGNANVFDIVGLYLILAGTRMLLDNASYTALSTGWRTFTTSQGQPIAWAKFNPTTFYVGPVPGVAYTMEVDACQANGTALALDADVDPLPYPFTEPVPYFAAYLCRMNQREYDEADKQRENYWDALRTIESSKAGMLPTGYPVIGR